jgi:cytochrome P450
MADLLRPENRRDPYPYLNRLRESDPVHRTATGYALSRHADVTRVFQESGTTFLSPDRAMFEAQFPGADKHRSLSMFFSTFALHNPPEHTRIRRRVAREFTTRRVDALEPRMAELCDELLDSVEEPLRDGETVDLHHAVALPLTIAVLAELLGIPAADSAWLSSLVAGVVSAYPGAPDEVMDLADRNTVEMEEYLRPLIAARRVDPRDDMISALAAWRPEDDEPLTDDDLVPTFWALWSAGFVTSAGLLGNSVLAMFDEPGQHGLLADRDGRFAFVDEVLRHSPVTVVAPFIRIAASDVEFDGGVVTAGSDVRLLIGAANRDPAAFGEPDRFDPARGSRVASLAFGGGIHYCVGAAFARAEASSALGRLRDRFPTLTAAAEPVWGDIVFHRIAEHLPVALEPTR